MTFFKNICKLNQILRIFFLSIESRKKLISLQTLSTTDQKHAQARPPSMPTLSSGTSLRDSSRNGISSYSLIGNSSNFSSGFSVASSTVSSFSSLESFSSGLSKLWNEVEWKKYEFPSSDVSEIIVLLTLTIVPSSRT